MAITVITMICVPTVGYLGFEEISQVLFFCMFYLPFIAVGIFAEMPLIPKILWSAFVIIHSFFMFLSTPIADAMTSDNMYIIGLIVGTLCLFMMIILFKIMSKRTKYGIEMLGRIRGFKNFLMRAEKEKLESMVLENPNYFYDILPYTYVLDVSDKWIKKFESISLKAPSWYDSTNEFNVSNFGSFMDNTMYSAETVMSSSPYSGSGGSDGSSSSSSSGGGSSGDGSGGGGGGSW